MKPNKDVDLLKALQKVLAGVDVVDVVIFVILLMVFPPLPIIWFVVRVIQEMN